MRRAFIVRRPHKPCALREAFAAGLRHHGWQVETARQPIGKNDLVVIWGVRNQALIAEEKRKGVQLCVLERGYLGDRFKWTSVSFGGGLNGRGEFRGVSKDRSRFKEHHADLMRPWSSRAGYTLLIGQVPNDMSLKAVYGRLDRWYRETASLLVKAGHDVRFRPHPGATARGLVESVPGAPSIGGTLEAAIAGAGLVVTFNSNTAVEAGLAGVPTVTIDEGSMAWEVTGHDPVGPRLHPSRGRWAAELAWKQWSVNEMETGRCWDAVKGDL